MCGVICALDMVAMHTMRKHLTSLFVLVLLPLDSNTKYLLLRGNSLRVHHYIGSWDSFRQPGFDNRGLNAFKERNNEQNTVIDNTTGFSEGATWLARFVDLVGKDKALSLTQHARFRAEGEKRMIEEHVSNSKIDWSRINAA